MTETIVIRPPTSKDGLKIWNLVRSCPPLDLNSPYCYMVLGQYFANTCAVAEADGKVGGFATGFISPENPSCLFVWQVGISPEFRKKGLAFKLIRDILTRPQAAHVKYIETTVGPSNESSHQLFLKLARELNAPVKESTLFSKADFGANAHEDEILVRIGPFKSKPKEELKIEN